MNNKIIDRLEGIIEDLNAFGFNKIDYRYPAKSLMNCDRFQRRLWWDLDYILRQLQIEQKT